MNGIWIWIPVTLLALLLGAGVGYLIKQSLIERDLRSEKA
jgi:uncharacterized protein YneF (UPF0154 family)